MAGPGDYYKWLHESTLALFAEFEGMKGEEIMEVMVAEGLFMPPPLNGKSNDINHCCSTAQFLMKRTGRRVCVGTTTFTFDDEHGGKQLRYFPDNMVYFNWLCWTGKTLKLYK